MCDEQGGEIMSKKKEADVIAETPSNGFSVNKFVEGTKEEFEKVVWPSRKQVLSESAAVLLMVTLSASLIFLVDKLFTWGAQQVFG